MMVDENKMFYPHITEMHIFDFLAKNIEHLERFFLQKVRLTNYEGKSKM